MCTQCMFIRLFMIIHIVSLMMFSFLYCSAIFTDLLLVVTPDFIFSRLSWAYPTRKFLLFFIMWMATIPANAPISYDRWCVVSFSEFTICTTPNHLLFVTNHFTIHSAVAFSGANFPIYDPSETITRVSFLVVVAM